MLRCVETEDAPGADGSGPAEDGTTAAVTAFPRFSWRWSVTALGAAWGVAGYAVLWGYTPFVAPRSFVVSGAGTVAFLPVRLVLRGIHLAEGVAGRAFELSASHGWIGVAAGLVGAGVALLAAFAIAGIAGRIRGRRTRPR